MNQKLLKSYKGSFLLSPAHGRAGARPTLLSFSVSAPPPSEKIAGGFQQAGKKEGGLGEGIFARLLRAEGTNGCEAFPPFCNQNIKAKQFSFFNLIIRATPFLLKGVENCFALLAEFQRAETRLRISVLRKLVGVRVFLKMSSGFFQQTPPKFIYSGICLARGFAPRFGGHFSKIIPRIFEINRQFSRRKAAVHKLLSLYCDLVAMSRWFSFAFGEIQNEILINCRCNNKIKNF